MIRFHISADGLARECKAKGPCPLGENEAHFPTREEAQKYIDEANRKEHEILPGIDSEPLKDEFENKPDNISEKWAKRFLEHKDFDEFVDEYAEKIAEDELFEIDSDILKNLGNVWKNIHYENSAKDLKDVTQLEAVTSIRKYVRKGHLNGWLSEANSDFKPGIESAIITNPELRNACLNASHKIYQSHVDPEVSYEDFLNKDIKIYRGGNFDYIDNDVFISYSFTKEIAEEFQHKTKGHPIEERIIKMKDTLGSLQTSGETEIMVPRRI